MNVQIGDFNLGDNTLWLDKGNDQKIASTQETAIDGSKIFWQSNYHNHEITLETYLTYTNLQQLKAIANSINSIYYFKYYDYEGTIMFNHTDTLAIEAEPLLNFACAEDGTNFYKTTIHLIEI